MAYTKVFTNPHPNGWDNPSERPPITADVLQAHTDAIQAIDNYLAAGGGAGGGGGGDYILPVATKTILGGVKVDGDTIAVTSDGTISVTAKAGAIKNTSDLSNDGSGSGSYFVEASELAQVAFAGNWSALEGKPTIPTKTSQLTNDSNFLSTIPKATTTTLGGIKLDGETLAMDINGVVSVVGGTSEGASYLVDLEDVHFSSAMLQNGDVLTYNSESSTWVNQAIDLGAGSRELTLAEYDALTAEEKADGTDYYITDADNINPDSIGTAGSLKPWLYDSNKEVVIGVYDGKPLYRKMYYIAEPEMSPTTSTLITIAEIENVEKIISTKGQIGRFISEDSDTLYYPINTHEKESSYFFFVRPRKDVDTNTIYIEYLAYFNADSVKDLTITIEYTKTTDTENSGINLMPYSFVQNSGSGFNYSTEEQVVGNWLGKTLYQKSYHMLCEAETTYLLDEEIKQTMHILTSIQGTWVFGSYTLSDVFQASINSPVGNQNTTINPPSIFVDAEGLKIKPNHNIYGYEVNFTIQYTKITD